MLPYLKGASKQGLTGNAILQRLKKAWAKEQKSTWFHNNVGSSDPSRLWLENNFPRVWVPSPENRDLRQLLWHRHRLVRMRTRIMNQLQALAMNEGQRRKKKLWSEQGRAQLEKLPFATWASRRRKDLLELLDRMNPTIEGLSTAVEQEAKKRPEVLRLMTHPGVGPITGLAFVMIIGTPERFPCGLRKIPARAVNGWDISASRATLCCVIYWEKQRKQQHVVMWTGDVGTCTWRYVGKEISPRWLWPADSQFGCIGCGGTIGNTHSGSSSVRTRDSS
jgi:hypothetical protein